MMIDCQKEEKKNYWLPYSIIVLGDISRKVEWLTLDFPKSCAVQDINRLTIVSTL